MTLRSLVEDRSTKLPRQSSRRTELSGVSSLSSSVFLGNLDAISIRTLDREFASSTHGAGCGLACLRCPCHRVRSVLCLRVFRTVSAVQLMTRVLLIVLASYEDYSCVLSYCSFVRRISLVELS